MRNTCTLCEANAHGTVDGEKYCQRHYRRIQRNGDPQIVKKAGRPKKQTTGQVRLGVLRVNTPTNDNFKSMQLDLT